MKIKVIIEKVEEGGYVAFCPELKGCMSQGATLEKVKENIKEAAQGWIETKMQMDLEHIVKKNQEAKIPSNGHRTQNILINPAKFQLAGV